MQAKDKVLSATLLCGAIGGTVGCMGGNADNRKTSKDERPNVIVILLDDLGFADYGCTGSEVPTPNIDALAAEGILCRNFTNMARSAPSRASLMTGLYAHQAGIGALREIPGKPAYQFYVNDNSAFISESLCENGYYNVMTGKSHLGHMKGVTPMRRGFDQALNSPLGGFYFWNDTTIINNRERHLYLNDEELALDDPRLGPEWYITDLFTDSGLVFIDNAIDKGQPFFWYLAHIAGHFPIQAHQETIAKYKGKYRQGWEKVREDRYAKQLRIGLFNESEPLTPMNPALKPWADMSEEDIERYDTIMACYAAAIDELDQSVGRIVRHLKEKGVYENTVIFLMNDNGGCAEGGYEGVLEGDVPGAANSRVYLPVGWADVSNTPFLYYKHHGHEGGCNTPLIISYPNGIKKSLKGSVNKDFNGHFVDIAPTIFELSGTRQIERRGHDKEFAVQPLEGVSLVPLLKGKKVKRENPIIVEHEGNKMLRDGRWKVVQECGEKGWALYDMENDPTEFNDLAAQHPDILNEMIGKYHQEAARIGVDETIPFKPTKSFMPRETYFDQDKANRYLQDHPAR